MLLLSFSPDHEIIDPAKHLPNLDWQLCAVPPTQHHSKIHVVWICLINGYQRNAGGNPAMDWHPIQGAVKILLVASCHRNRDKLRL